MNEKPIITFWWQIVTFDRETILVSIQEAKQIKEAMRAGNVHISVRGKTIAVRDIRRLEASDKLVDPFTEQHLLASGAADTTKVEPIIDPNSGAVLARWAKMPVSRKRYESYYAAAGYKALEIEDNVVWVAFTKILMTNEQMSDNIRWCTPEECKRLGGVGGS
jgi:hypothetical protein